MSISEDIVDIRKELSQVFSTQSLFLNKANAACNFIDKYLPAQVHREVSRYILFVFGQEREVRMRCEWYDEIRTPLLTSLVLCDTGKDELQGRIDTQIPPTTFTSFIQPHFRHELPTSCTKCFHPLPPNPYSTQVVWDK